MKIKIKYRSCDGCKKNRVFSTVEKAQKFAQKYVGEHPEIGLSPFGNHYAVSADGVGIIEVSGIKLKELFPESWRCLNNINLNASIKRRKDQ